MLTKKTNILKALEEQLENSNSPLSIDTVSGQRFLCFVSEKNKKHYTIISEDFKSVLTTDRFIFLHENIDEVGGEVIDFQVLEASRIKLSYDLF